VGDRTQLEEIDMAFQFLSDDWFSEADRIVTDVAPPVPDAIKDLVINFRIKDAPDGDVEARMDGGRLVKGFGDDVPTIVNLPYEVARQMLVDNDQNAAMQAFMSGQIQVEGDMSRIMAMQGAGAPSEESQQVALRIREMTST
jgi:hypothetical protein